MDNKQALILLDCAIADLNMSPDDRGQWEDEAYAVLADNLRVVRDYLDQTGSPEHGPSEMPDHWPLT